MNNNQVIKIILFVILIVVTSSSSCDGECEKNPDLAIPEFINGQVQVASEFRYTVVGGIDYPYGTSVFLYNTINEFYSVVRSDPFGIPIVFYWNINSPPPFYAWASPPNHLLQPGEEVLVHRCVVNEELLDLDCLTKAASITTTEMKVIVRVENGQILDEQVKREETPSIPPGQYRVVSFPILINQLGSYELIFRANSDNSIEESDTTNNVYIQRPTNNLGAG